MLVFLHTNGWPKKEKTFYWAKLQTIYLVVQFVAKKEVDKGEKYAQIAGQWKIS
jgi:hypothetical protein